MVWWWLLLRNRYYWALSLTVSSVVRCSSHLCLVSVSLDTILLPSGLLSFYVYFLTYGGVDPLGVFPPFLEMVADIIAPKLNIISRRLMRRGSFPVCWLPATVTAIPKRAPPLIGKTTVTYQ